MRPGCAFADFTGDGLPDVYLPNGVSLERSTAPQPSDRFLINRGDGRFEDASPSWGVSDRAFGIGCCAGDYDNDGDLDLYVTSYGGNLLLRNEGGRFRDVTEEAGVPAGGFSSSAAFGDGDGDGDLDLYVCRYIEWSPARNRLCPVLFEGRSYPGLCRPNVYPAAADLLYRNNGNGTFTDATALSGVKAEPRAALGVAWVDFDADGDQDLFVANDMSPNYLFVNKGGGRFREEGTPRGVALDAAGHAQASMGIAVLDFNRDGHLDLACTNFAGEYLTLYQGQADGHFTDVSARSGLVRSTAPYVGFGVCALDYDLDGWPDLAVANGHVSGVLGSNLRRSLEEPRLLFRNDGRGGFIPAPSAGSPFQELRVGRGLAMADYDRDGAPDLLAANWGEAPELLQNITRSGNHWVRLSLEGTRCNRAAIGARVEVTTRDGTQVEVVQSGGSYASQGELPLTFGLGSREQADRVRVVWPGGGTSEWTSLASGREHHLVEKP